MCKDERRTDCSEPTPHSTSRCADNHPSRQQSSHRLHKWHRRSNQAASIERLMPAGRGWVAGLAVVTAAGQAVAETVAVAKVEAMEAAAPVVVTVAVTVVAMVVAAMEAATAELRTPHRHSNGHRGASVHPRSCKSDDCFPMRPRAARQVSRVRTPPMSRSAHCRAGSLCTERPSARAARTGGRRTARSAGRPAARSRCDNSRPC